MDIWLTIGTSALVTLSIAIAVLFGIWLFVRIAGKKIPWLAAAYGDIRPRLRFVILTFALLVSTLVVNQPENFWWVAVSQGLLILLILSAGFLIQAVVNYSVLQVIAKFESGDQSDAEVRRISTQLRLLRRLANVIIGILAIGFALFTFPAVQGIGAGLLASAGVLSVVGGLAAQSVLGNLFAGIQLAFSNAIRVGDVVVVEDEWGTIGEITLSYVVVYVWDERRLIVPSTHFTSKAFETWTRKTSKVLGTVFLDLDWRVPLDPIRDEFERFLKDNPLWDGRASGVVVTDARGGFVQVRFLISAEDSSKQWDLRCAVREHMVTWLQKNHPEALPVSRVSLENCGVLAENSDKVHSVTIRPIRITGDPVLRSPAAPVTRFDDELHELLTDMVDTMRAAPGVGLAAPQIGVSQQVFVWEWTDDNGILQEGAVINPTLHVGPLERRKADPDDDLEGCLSVPDFRYPLVRAKRVVLRGTTPQQTSLQITAEGWLARIFQHEFDHLQGTLYVDQLPWRLRRTARKEIRAEGFDAPGQSWLPGVDDFESDHEAEET